MGGSDDDFIRQLAAAGAQAPSADNSQPCDLIWDGRRLAVAFTRRAGYGGLFGARSHATWLSAGAMIEQLEATLNANGLQGDWRAGTPDGQPYASTALTDWPAEFRSAPAVLARHTNRLPFQRMPLAAALGAKLAAMRERDCRLVVWQQRSDTARAARWVRWCSEARFRDRELHDWLFNSLRYSPEDAARGDGLDLRTLALPPGGRQLMQWLAPWPRMARLNRLGLYKAMALAEAAPVAAAPALVCVVGPDDWQGALDAGRLMSRAWMLLNAEAVAVHPYYVISDQVQRLQAGTLVAGAGAPIANVRQELRQALACAAGDTLHMVLRVGYPLREPAVRSQRLPLAQVFHTEAERV